MEKFLCLHPQIQHSISPSPSSLPSERRGFGTKVRLLLPYVWPKGTTALQGLVLLCVGLLAAERLVNVLVPVYSRNIVNELCAGGDWTSLVATVCLYTLLKFLQGEGAGKHASSLISNPQEFLWIKFYQFTGPGVQLRFSSHLQGLSLRWHLERHTGHVLRSIDWGTSSVNNLLSYILFSILPTVCDIIIAIIYFVLCFRSTVSRCNGVPRYPKTAVNISGAGHLRIFQDVKYCNAEDHEVHCFEEAILKYQVSLYYSSASLALLNQTQNIIIGLGLLVGSLLCAYLLSEGQFQDTALFDDTVGNNVRYGRVTAAREEVERAATAAGVHRLEQLLLQRALYAAMWRKQQKSLDPQTNTDEQTPEKSRKKNIV
ncbi:ATP-binding cassette sub-family B member 6 [Channa argus]|uniref:ATP-binding cassette sub-family B member 6 n=1 Tax=Channa argus TaxID=215402 RepID=UPI003520B899